jgi:hypothetical protein
VLPRHLNKHIDYFLRPAPTGVKDHSLATPVGMAVTPDGTTLYVAAFGSSKIGVFDTATLESDTFDPVAASAGYLAVSGGGPSGLVLDEARHRLYVLTRFDDAVSVVDLGTGTETAHVALHTPSRRASSRDGRSSTTRRRRRRTARRRARAATSSATWTTSRGTWAIPTRPSRRTRSRSTSASRSRSASSPCRRRKTARARSTTSIR